MIRLALLAFAAAVLSVVAPSMGLAQDAPRPAGDTPASRTILLGQPFLQVIRTLGQPSRVRSVELVPVAGGKSVPAVVWIHERPTGMTLEYLIGDEGKVLQTTIRSKQLDPFRIEPKP